MAILVTMQVGPVDWPKFKAALESFKDIPAQGLISSQVYRAQSDPNIVMVIEQWDSQEAMHAYQDKVGDDFNERARTAGMDWQTGVWQLTD
jgi:quinol monooxygenase YgiN